MEEDENDVNDIENDSDDDQGVQLDELLEGLALDTGPDVKEAVEEEVVLGNNFTQEELENMTELERFQLQKGRTFFSEGEKAKIDKLGYVGKDASKDVPNKSSASVVQKFGDNFKAGDFSFL